MTRLTVRWDKEGTGILGTDLNNNVTVEFNTWTEEMEIGDGSPTNFSLTSVLYFPENLTSKLDGVYSCTFSNSAGSSSSTTKLYIQGE